jgi:predicted RNA binding protein YcfA (HicA-like mRNA interferase family)
MPPLSDLPGSVSREALLRALARLGFSVDKSGGKGDHYKVEWPSTRKCLTLPHKVIPKQVLKYIIKEIEEVSMNAITWENIRNEL